jgi:tRNA A37 methylthiotransferase MiaB
MARIEVETFGCAMNQADSEIIAGLLEEHGHVIVPEKGDVIVVNTCTVKTPTEVKIRRRLRELEKACMRVVVAGCLPSASPAIADEFKKFSFVGVNVHDVPAAVESALSGRRLVLIKNPQLKLCLPKRRLNPFVEIVPIAEGCLGSCSYCITRSARGGLRSFPLDGIVKQVRMAAADGVREVWLTAQDTGAYGLDIGENLPRLLEKVAEVPGDFKVRVGMMNPNHVLGFLDELLEAYRSLKVYRFLHLPVQSGSSRVLKHMGRKYTADDFRMIVRKFREKLDGEDGPGFDNALGGRKAPLFASALADVQPLGTTISTDIIAGYPTEGEDDMKATIALINETEPDIVNISRYWPRQGTSAAALRQHPGSVTKQRSRQVNEAFKGIGLKRNRRWVGWEGEAIVSERNPDGTYTARNGWYKPIVIKSAGDVFGKKVLVKVLKATYFDLRGTLKKL